MDTEPRLLVVALVLIRQGESILLVQQDYGRQYWSLPGGMVEHGEAVDQAAIREVREETSLEVSLTRLVGLYSKPEENALAITFEGEITGGEIDPQNEVRAARFFPLTELPNNIRHHLRQRIEDYGQNHPHAVVRTQ
jgi:ADP-ribose pyrophosphatase YjhB (NUDIX family)